MNRKELIQAIEQQIRQQFEGESTGHDWHHINRVRTIALNIQETEGGDPTVVEVASLLHDIDDHKFNGGDWDAGATKARIILENLALEPSLIDHVCDIISNVSYKGAGVETPMHSIEGKIVQDADRIDALGAIGIARTFAYGGHKGHPIYDPKQPPTLHQTKEAYTKTSHTINHFYEKLLLLKDRMNTKTGRKIAEERHQFMENFLKQFYEEWGA
jgi:uncharacterized protein